MPEITMLITLSEAAQARADEDTQGVVSDIMHHLDSKHPGVVESWLYERPDPEHLLIIMSGARIEVSQ